MIQISVDQSSTVAHGAMTNRLGPGTTLSSMSSEGPGSDSSDESSDSPEAQVEV